MRIARTILAFLIAVSVTMLPVAGSAVAGAKSAEMSEMAAIEDMHDCCAHKANPCDKAMDDCQSMATCALKCFSFSGTSFSSLAFPSPLASVSPSLATDPFYSQTGNPPFRPPRV